MELNFLHQELSNLTEDEKSIAKAILNPVLWCETTLRDPENPKKYLRFRPLQREAISYQPYYTIDEKGNKILLHRMKVYRIGRRYGKTLLLAAEALHKACTNFNFKILYVAPFECLTKDSKILMSDGSYKTIEYLINNFHGKEVLALDKNYKFIKSKINNVHYSNTTGIYKLILDDKKEIKCSDNHKFLTIDGWKELKELKVGDYVATPREIKLNNKNKIDKNTAKLIGYIISDGTTCNDIRFSNASSSILKDFKRTCINFDNKLLFRNEYRHGCMNIRVVANDGWLGKNARINPLFTLFKKYNLMFKDASEKFIPEDIFKSSNEVISYFLKSLYSCDGSVIIGKKTISYSTCNRILADQIRSILLRFGISSFLAIGVYSKGKYVDKKQYYVNIYSYDEISKFKKFIGFIGEKEKKLNILLKSIQQNEFVYSKDIIPKEIYNHIKSELKISISKFFNPCYNGDNRKSYSKNNNITRKYFSHLISYYKGDTVLYKLANSDVYWRKIKSVKCIGKDDVYDLEIDNNHNFVANDIIVHNSQCNIFFNMIDALMANTAINPVRFVRKPFIVEYGNGSLITGHTANVRSTRKGSTIRGAEADFIIVDEMDFGIDEVINEVIMPIYMGNDRATIVGASTPTGRRGLFWTWCNMGPKLGIQEFHATSKDSPKWTDQAEKLARATMTAEQYTHEICFHPSQKILLSNGNSIKIKNININDELISNINGEINRVKVINKKLTRSNAIIKKYITWMGNVISTPDHKIKTCVNDNIVKEEIDKSDNIIVSPIIGIYPNNKNYALARLIAHLHSDGSICQRKNGNYIYYQASCYSKYKKDLEFIANDCEVIFGKKPNICRKKIEGYEGNYQIILNHTRSKFLVEMGGIVGKKTEQKWTVPKWIRKSNDINLKLEYIGSLWGGEGSKNIFENGKYFRSLSFSMCKINKDLISDLFVWIKNILKQCGIKLSYIIKDNDIKVSYNKRQDKYFKNNAHISEILYTFINYDNALNIFKYLKPRYSYIKEREFFYGLIYNNWRLYNLRELKNIVSIIRNEYNKNNHNIVNLVNKYGFTHSQIQKMVYKDKKIRYSRVQKNVKPMNLKILDDGSCIIPICKKLDYKNSDVYNITVNSKDNSYLLDGYFNIFNCADFGESVEGVFRHKDLDAIMKPYNYNSLKYNKDNDYIMGVDWNENYGVCIVIVERLRVSKKFRIFKHVIVPKQEFIQTEGVNRIINIHESECRCNFLYVDRGFGSTQIELLKKYGLINKRSKLAEITKDIDYGGNIEVRDPVTGEKTPKPAKAFLINNTQLVTERHGIEIPEDEDTDFGLIGQLRNFRVTKFSRNNVPVYDGDNNDHSLNALALALVGFTLEMSDVNDYEVTTHISNVINFNIPRTQFRDNVSNEQVEIFRQLIARTLPNVHTDYHMQLVPGSKLVQYSPKDDKPKQVRFVPINRSPNRSSTPKRSTF